MGGIPDLPSLAYTNRSGENIVRYGTAKVMLRTLFYTMSTLYAFFVCLITTVILVAVVAFIILVERKLLALSQRRIGPAILGRRGILQIFADIVKPLFKDIFEQRLQTITTVAASIFFLFFTQLIFSDLFSFGVGVSLYDDAELIILIQLTLTTLSCISVTLIGYLSGSKYGMIGSIRLAMSEISVDAAVMVINSLLFYNCSGFDYDSVLTSQAVSANIFLLAVVAGFLHIFQLFIAAQRSPIDLIEVEGELVAGYNTEYSGPDVLVIYFSEYFHLFNGALHFIFMLFGLSSIFVILL